MGWRRGRMEGGGEAGLQSRALQGEGVEHLIEVPESCCFCLASALSAVPAVPSVQVEHLEVPEAAELRKLKLLKDELGELAAQGGCTAAGTADVYCLVYCC